MLEHYQRGSSTSWSTSTRTPTRSRTSSSSCSPPSTATSASSATATSRSTGFRGADIAQHPRVRGGVPRRHGDRARAELPLDPDHPRRRQRGHRQQPRPQAEGAVDRPGRRRGRSSATTPTTRATRRSGSSSEIVRSCTTTATRAGATSPSSTGPTPRAGCSRSTLMRAGIPYKVVGGTRFYDRREVKDALAYLQAVVNPADEVSVKRVLNVPEAGRRRHHRRPARRLGHRPRPHVHRGAAPGRRRRASAAGPSRASTRSSACSTSAADARRRGPGPLLEALLDAQRLRRRARRPSTPSRPRAGSRTWPSWSARPHEFETVDEFLEQVSLVADTDELDADESLRSCS